MLIAQPSELPLILPPPLRHSPSSLLPARSIQMEIVRQLCKGEIQSRPDELNFIARLPLFVFGTYQNTKNRSNEYAYQDPPLHNKIHKLISPQDRKTFLDISKLSLLHLRVRYSVELLESKSLAN